MIYAPEILPASSPQLDATPNQTKPIPFNPHGKCVVTHADRLQIPPNGNRPLAHLAPQLNSNNLAFVL